MKFSSLYVKFNLVRFLGTIIVTVTLVIGHESFTSMATPWALDLRGFLFGILVQFQLKFLYQVGERYLSGIYLYCCTGFLFFSCRQGRIRSKKLV